MYKNTISAIKRLIVKKKCNKLTIVKTIVLLNKLNFLN